MFLRHRCRRRVCADPPGNMSVSCPRCELTLVGVRVVSGRPHGTGLMSKNRGAVVRRAILPGEEWRRPLEGLALALGWELVLLPSRLCAEPAPGVSGSPALTPHRRLQLEGDRVIIRPPLANGGAASPQGATSARRR